ncbi:MAG TPA: hypothetical protein PKK11_06225 [Methanothrix sp.]|nr:hypothetical protein [Methanothrix sp.]HPT19857.1 hypothetical protein [Methanothrix sp.]
MRRLDISDDSVFLPILIILIAIGTALGQDAPDDSDASNQLILNIYIDDAGRALINGYIDDLKSLAFLNSTEYTYEDDSKQIYAITGALTSKSGDDWMVSLESKGRYDLFQVLFYLPANAKLRGIDSSAGIEHLISTANESVIAEIRGSDITDPAVNIEYLLSFAEMPKKKLDTANISNIGYQYTIIGLALIIGLGILIFLWRSKLSSSARKGKLEHIARTEPCVSYEKPPDLPAPKYDAEMPEAKNAPVLDHKHGSGIEINSETSAVMDTLTDKEKSVFKALLRRGGTMTQTEIRYEVDISKSSLSGILTSMEKRKIITKKEKGRTNVIELSERFLNTLERS